MLDVVLSWIERFQTGIVGVFGFLGVIYTIYSNGKLARDQHERQLNHERAGLRTALCAELELFRDIYADRSKSLSTVAEGQSSLLPDSPHVTVYHQLLDKLGLLTGSEVTLLMKAYALISELPVRVRLLELEDFGANHVRPGYIEVSGRKATAVASMHDGFRKVLEEALAAVRGAMEAERGI